MNPKRNPAKRPRLQGQFAAEKPGGFGGKTKFEGYGEEMIEKTVKQSGNSGRVYLPPEWVGKNVKIIRIN
ncbi:MAG: DUF2080 family transposase-associated protein [Proteobacteria bacterium]|nr:DUF2080 family transposase-associated protein [Pseudomonadota bacterium]MBU4383069.1 DUF2080 family transposase-associated protein [Pseudomonadota bacterium]MBU4605167.1 DUF2080 family transposase-associated protein [Pseudomonadota bacterium]MCG2762827.1 DUF2080 family transposase-associated protein [Desulfarculaceae bacterium]